MNLSQYVILDCVQKRNRHSRHAAADLRGQEAFLKMTNPEVKTHNWMNETIHLLNKKAKTKELKLIAVEAGVRYTWLHSLYNGKIADPSINIMNKLYDYLVKK